MWKALRSPWPFAIALCSVSGAAGSELVAANNLQLGQQSTYAWEEVGLAASDVYTNGAKGQSFFASATGRLQTLNTLIGAGVDDRVPNSPPLLISIYTAVDGRPMDRLATVTMTAVDFQPIFERDDHRASIDFVKHRVEMIAGNEYMTVYECPYAIAGPNGNYAPYHIGMIVNGQNSLGHQLSFALDGHSWEKLMPEPPYTFELATQISLIPEPNGIVLAAGGVLCLLSARHNEPRFRRETR